MKILKTSAVIGALFIAGASTAVAGPITFNTQTNGQFSVSTFDWKVDNALAVGSVPLPSAPTTAPSTLYSQASLGNFLDSSANVINGTGLNTNYEITFQTGFGELGTRTVSPGVGEFASFSLDPAATVNFFNIYYDTSIDANQATGTGYDDGQLILSAVILNNSTVFFVPYNAQGAPNIVPLDNFGGNDLPGVLTVVGSGGGQLEAAVTGMDGAFFWTSFDLFLVDLMFNTSTVTPFNQAQPSTSVVGNVPNYGLANINGTCPGAPLVPNCDFQFQSDANMSFNAVPEPGSLALAGLALSIAGLGMLRRKS